MRAIKFRAWDGEKMQTIFRLTDDGQIYTLSSGEEQWHDWSLLQFTGLKDKNGKEIYEGDVIEGTAVQFVDGCFWLGTQSADQWPTAFIEVIGNIYENPDLLK